MRKEFMVGIATMISFVIVGPNKIKAQEKDSLRTVRLADVVITASKFPKSQTETGKVLTVIDEEKLSVSQGKDLSQLLNEQVGLTINGATSNPAKDKSVFLRGASGSYTLIMLDGVPLTDPSGVGGAFDLRMIPLDQVSRIEILKGSQSTLYGTDAIAGVINIITKQGGGKQVEGFGNFSYGSYSTLKANVGVSGSLKHLDYNLMYSRFRSDGISEAKDERGTGNFDKDGFTQDGIQLSLGVNPTEKISIRPFIRYSEFDGQYDAGAFTDDPDALFDSQLVNAGFSSQLKWTGGSINLLYAFTKTERTFTDAYGTTPYDGWFSHGETFINHDLSKHVQLLGGLGYQHFKMRETNGAVPNSSTNIFSPYVSVFLRNVHGLSAEVGGRFVLHSVYGNNVTFSINPSYLVAKKVKMFVNYTTGFKAPTLSQLFGPFGANEELEPEESKSLEGGVQFISLKKNFDVRANVFSRKIDNAIAYTTGYVNLNTLNDWGLELESGFKWNKITMTGFYAFISGEYTTDTQNGRETLKNELIRRPKHSFGINIGYRVSHQLLASVNFKTFSKRNDLFFDLNSFTNTAVILDPYQLLDFYTEYSMYNGKLKVFVDVRNILNQLYYEVYGYCTQGLTVMTGVSFRFLE